MGLDRQIMTDPKIPADPVGAFVPHTITEPIRGSGEGPPEALATGEGAWRALPRTGR